MGTVGEIADTMGSNEQTQSRAASFETAAQWWERVRAEHGPPPARVGELYRSTVRAVVARSAEQAEPVARSAGGRS